MPATNAIIGYGTLLSLGQGTSPETYVDVAEVKNIDPVGTTLENVDATTLTSPNRTKEYVAGLQDGDTLTFTCNLVVANRAILKAWNDAGLRSNWKLTFPYSPVLTRIFGAIPASWHEKGMTPSGILEVTIGMKIAGAIV